MAKIYLHPFSDAVIALSAFFLLSLLTLDMSRGKYLDALFGTHFFCVRYVQECLWTDKKTLVLFCAKYCILRLSKLMALIIRHIKSTFNQPTQEIYGQYTLGTWTRMAVPVVLLYLGHPAISFVINQNNSRPTSETWRWFRLCEQHCLWTVTMLISELLFIIKIVVGVGELLKLPKQRKAGYKY